MKFDSVDHLKDEGFTGFKKIGDLIEDQSHIPNGKGVYLVVHKAKDKPEFIMPGVGGCFKERDPNTSRQKLESNWVDKNVVIYIGQAGGGKSNQTLRKRIRQYMKFGQGENVPHWGGRYIWQIENYRDLLICWKTTDQDPRDIEKNLILGFQKIYGKRPFANLSN